jgi:hypothetical protein
MTKDVTVKFKGDTSEAQAAAKGLADNITSSMAGAIAGVVSLGAATAALTGFVKEGAAAARAHQEAEILLATALKNRGDATGAIVDRLKVFNAQMSIKKGIDETELVNLPLADRREMIVKGIVFVAVGHFLSERSFPDIGPSSIPGDLVDELRAIWVDGVDRSEFAEKELERCVRRRLAS